MVTGAGDTTELDERAGRRKRLALAAAGAAVVAVALWLLWPDDGDDDGRRGRLGTETEVGTFTGDDPDPFRYLQEIRVGAGERAQITNPDDEAHTFTSDDGLFDSGTVAPGDAAVLPSLYPGRYGFHCEIHPALTGELVIS